MSSQLGSSFLVYSYNNKRVLAFDVCCNWFWSRQNTTTLVNDNAGWAAYGSDFDGDVFLDAVSLATVLVHLGVHDALKLVELLLKKKNQPQRIVTNFKLTQLDLQALHYLFFSNQ